MMAVAWVLCVWRMDGMDGWLVENCMFETPSEENVGAGMVNTGDCGIDVMQCFG